MLRTTSIELSPREPFDFLATVESHGWPQLAPFEWDGRNLSRPESTSDGPVDVTMRGTAIGEKPARVWTEVHHLDDLAPSDLTRLASITQRVLDLDADLSKFHDLCRDQPGFESVLENGKGRVLRSGTMFEDVVKTILTTNVNWAGTKRMVRRLVDALGTPLPWRPEQHTFPTAEQIVAGEALLREGKLGMGYRGPYILELAHRVAAGEIDLSRWEDPSLSAASLYKQMREVKGIGDYAASSLMMLLGHAERIPMDSWARKLLREQYFSGRNVTDRELEGAFDRFGPWRGRAFMFYSWRF
jgi:3-methyladenine DNA glycosylase/8-oxoguanine DNA glycosylase